MRVQITDCSESMEAIRLVRDTVFGQEQNVPPELEWDGEDQGCIHVLATDASGAPIGTGRLMPDGRIGRMAVLKPWRGRGVGSAMLDALVAEARQRRMPRPHLHAQLHAVAFYEKRGFEKDGEGYMEAGIPHINMRRREES